MPGTLPFYSSAQTTAFMPRNAYRPTQIAPKRTKCLEPRTVWIWQSTFYDINSLSNTYEWCLNCIILKKDIIYTVCNAVKASWERYY